MNFAELSCVCSDKALVVWMLGCLLQYVDETVPGENEKIVLGTIENTVRDL